MTPAGAVSRDGRLAHHSVGAAETLFPVESDREGFDTPALERYAVDTGSAQWAQDPKAHQRSSGRRWRRAMTDDAVPGRGRVAA